MLKPRILPCLQIDNGALVKTRQFKNPTYIGDPLNAIKIFNQLEIHELVLLNISKNPDQTEPPFGLIEKVAEECCVPFSYGGKIKTVQQIKEILYRGAEKIILNTWAFEDPQLIDRASSVFGSQSIIISIDAARNLVGEWEVLTRGGTIKTGKNPIDWALEAEKRGAGEIFLQCVERDGMMNGFEIKLIESLTNRLQIPLIACSGAGSFTHLSDCLKFGKASAVAAGSLFVFYGPRKSVLINFPSKEEIEEILKG